MTEQNDLQVIAEQPASDASTEQSTVTFADR